MMSDDVVKMPADVLKGWLPGACVIHPDRDSSELMFLNGERGEYQVRGALSFPRIVNGEAWGGALVCGRDVLTGRISVFSESRWCVSRTNHGLPGTSASNHLALDAILQRAWLTFGCRRWGWSGEISRARLVAFEVRSARAAMDGLRPKWDMVQWPEGDYALPTLAAALQTGLLVSRPCAVLDDALVLIRGGAENAVLNPLLEALVTALTQFSVRPWRGAGGAKSDEPVRNGLPE